jgi:5-methylcytosine-specific restriction endonuclease McrA
MATNKQCKKCGELKPLTTDYFNLLTGGTWRGNCKMCQREVTRKHSIQNPEMVAARRSRYKENLQAAEGSYQVGDITLIRKAQNDACYYCGCALNGLGEKDHKVPLSNGGTNWAFNIALACRTCNRDKGNKSEQEFIAWRKSLNLPVKNTY